MAKDFRRDRSWEIIPQLAVSVPCIRGINLMRNYGQHNALLCGIRTARAAVIFTMDDDLQHQPEKIPRLLAREGFKIVYAAPGQRTPWFLAHHRIPRHSVGAAFCWGAEVARHMSALRVFRTKLREAFADY